MKIYYNGELAATYDYAISPPFTTPAEFNQFTEVHEVDPETGAFIKVIGNESSITNLEWEKKDTDYIAGKKITSVYPEYKQLNILRNGTDAEKTKMQTYIDAVRAWANSSSPDPWDGTLDAITP